MPFIAIIAIVVIVIILNKTGVSDSLTALTLGAVRADLQRPPAHALHEHGTDHTAPTDQTYTFHNHYTFNKQPAATVTTGLERLQTPQRRDYCVAP